MYSTKNRFCRKCSKKLSYNSELGTFECLGCIFRALPEEERFDSEIHLYKKNSLKKDIQLKHFFNQLRISAKDIYFTKLFLIINIVVYLGTAWASESLSTMNIVVLRELGGSIGKYIFSGEYFRLISTMFLHGSFFHLFMNMLALWFIGGITERLLGNFSYMIVYFFSGIIGSLFSLFSHSSDILSVGASGAIAGIFGALVIFALKKKIPIFIANSILKNAVFMIVLNVVIGLSFPQIDNSAHLGGFLSGLLMTYFIAQDIKNINKLKRIRDSLLVSCLMMLIILSSWKPIGEINKYNTSPTSKFEKIISRFNHLEEMKAASIERLILKFQQNKISKKDAIKKLENDYLMFFEKEGAILYKFIDEISSDEYLTEYTRVYLDYYKKFWLQIKLYFETGNELFLKRASFLNKVKNKLRPEDFK